MELLPWTFSLILAVGFFSTAYCDDFPVFQTNLGEIKGSILSSDEGLEFFAFRGIPYAKPPVKELRFEAPQALIEKWTGVLDATEDGHVCIQDEMFIKELMGDEDCLYLNVYTPKVENQNFEKPLPVMVFIHGGGFYSGSGASSFYGPQRLMDKTGIVLVTINYRLGPFGFLSTLDENSPGNYGLLDQVMALEWVRDNIAAFGGNPNQVTLFGESAGSVSVGLHMISPLSKGLFHAAIAQSGSVLSEWAVHVDDNLVLNKTKELARLLNCPTDCHRAMMKCLKRLPSLDIVVKAAQQNHAHIKDDCYIMVLKPVVDIATRGENAFLPDFPYNLLINKRFQGVPIMAGVTKDEGLSLQTICPRYMEEAVHNKDHFSTILKSFHPSLYENDAQWKRTSQDIVSSYFQNDVDTDGTQKIRAAIDLATDSVMSYKVDVMNEILAKSNVPTYAYKLTYRGEHSVADSELNDLVTHIDDLQYLFRCVYFKSTVLSGDDNRMKDIMLTLWTNFAKTGVPSLEGSIEDHHNFKWEPITSNNYKYLDLNLTPAMVDGRLSNKHDFWKNTYMSNRKDEL